MARAGQCLRARDGRIARRRARSSRAQARVERTQRPLPTSFRQVERTTIVGVAPCGYWLKVSSAGRRRQQRARGRGQGRGQRLGFAAARLWSKSERPAQRREACSTMPGKQPTGNAATPCAFSFCVGTNPMRRRLGHSDTCSGRFCTGCGTARQRARANQTPPAAGGVPMEPRCRAARCSPVCPFVRPTYPRDAHAVQVIRTRMGRSGCKRCGRFVAAPPHPRDTVAVASALCTG